MEAVIDLGHIEIKTKKLSVIIRREQNLEFFMRFFTWASNYHYHLFKSFEEFLLEGIGFSEEGLTITPLRQLEGEDVYLVEIDQPENCELMFWRLSDIYEMLGQSISQEFFTIGEIEFSLTSRVFLSKKEIINEFLLGKDLNDNVFVFKENEDSIFLTLGIEGGSLIFRFKDSSIVNIEVIYNGLDALAALRDLIIQNQQENIKKNLKNVILQSLRELEIPSFKLLEELENSFGKKIS